MKKSNVFFEKGCKKFSVPKIPKLFCKGHIFDDPSNLPHQHLVNDYFHIKQIGKHGKISWYKSFNKTYKYYKKKYIDLSKKSPLKSYLIIMSFMVFGITIFDTGGNLFKASLTDTIPPFDGTIYPFKKSPNWFKTGGKNTRHFSSYSDSELISAPRYNAKLMQQEKWEKDIVNSKITYSIVYMGQYKYNHIEKKGSHPGVDIKLPTGTPILSIANGVVVKALDKTTGYGKHVVIKHTGIPQYGTLYSAYAHMSKINVKVGQIVKKGEKIGEVGSTGNSTTPHIHFQVDKENAPFHPYWPFTWEDAKKAGVSYTQAVNIGLGKEKGLKYTENPFTFIHQFQHYKLEKSTPLNTNNSIPKNIPSKNTTQTFHSSAPQKSPIEKNINILDRFELTASPNKILEGDSIIIKIIALNKKQARIRDFNEVVELSYKDGNENKNIFIKLKKGLAERKLIFNNSGRKNIRVKFNNIFKSTNVIVKKRPKVLAEINGKDTKTSGKIENFDHFKISGESAVRETESIALTIRPLDKNGNTIASKNFPSKGAYAISVKNGVVTPNKITKGDFSTGEFTFRFKGKKRGSAWVKVGDTKFEINVLQKIAPKQMLDEENTKIPHSDAKEITQTGTKIFSDVYSSHKNAKAISYLKAHNIINGYADGSFRPQKTVSRAEAIKMIFSALGIKEENYIDNPFKDVANNDWFSPYVLAAYNLDIVGGYQDGSFKPEKTVNRSEYFKIFLNAGDVVLTKKLNNDPFGDTKKDEWFAPYAKFAKEEKLLDFYGNKFAPTKEMTRAEVAETIYRFLR